MKSKKSMMTILLTFSLLSITACNTRDYPVDTDHSPAEIRTEKVGEGQDSTSEDTHYTIYEGDPHAPLPEIREIILPADGETLQYPDGFVIYQDVEGRALTATEAFREGTHLYFKAEDSEYVFELAMTMLTAEQEVFVSLNPVQDKTSAFDYVICTVDHLNEADRTVTIDCTVRDIAGRLGEEYSSEKHYYYVAPETSHVVKRNVD